MDNYISLAPIALFVYNRPWHTRQTIEALQKNELSNKSELFIFSDGHRDDKDKENVEKVREYLKTMNGFKSVNVILRNGNLGLAKSIVTGVTDVINRYRKVIVMEDDLVSSPYFIRFVNEALNLYENEQDVIGIHGYNMPVKGSLPETFFLRDPGCLGWATWKRGWDLFEQDGKKLLNELAARNLTEEFDYNKGYAYTKMLKDQIDGKIESWAILWYASIFLKNKFCLYPGQSLIRHIGNDGSGTNFGKSNILNCRIKMKPVTVKRIPIEENKDMRKKIECYFYSVRPTILSRVRNRIFNSLKIKYN